MPFAAKTRILASNGAQIMRGHMRGGLRAAFPFAFQDSKLPTRWFLGSGSALQRWLDQPESRLAPCHPSYQQKSAGPKLHIQNFAWFYQQTITVRLFGSIHALVPNRSYRLGDGRCGQRILLDSGSQCCRSLHQCLRATTRHYSLESQLLSCLDVTLGKKLKTPRGFVAFVAILHIALAS